MPTTANPNPEQNVNPNGSEAEVGLPAPDAAVATDNRNPRRRRPESDTAELGVIVEAQPCHALDRLVLHKETRDEIVVGVRSIIRRDELEDVWHLSEIEPQVGRCILNFYGPPGTGKTRAALGIALQLGQPLYQVDYSAIISKYLGDTAKHLVACFKRAAELNAVLFFDEADSMLSKRVNMDESCATSLNQNRNVLMQELDRFNGVVVCTTNLFGNYDPALLRRISRHIEFKLPDRAMRRKLFKLHLPNGNRVEADLDAMARNSEGLSGGDIKVACLNAIFAGSTDDDAANWKVTDFHLLAEIDRIKTAKANHGGAGRANNGCRNN
ncbi:MAG: ATP-binding protein [Verrucomicrobiia bacterium]